jgi:hypothetical protein
VRALLPHENAEHFGYPFAAEFDQPFPGGA